MTTATEAFTPDEIGPGFVARLVPALEVAAVGDEHVVIGGATQLVVLNHTAALIFELLDGETSLGELVDDFTEVLGLDRSAVEDDVLAFVRELGVNGLLEGVARLAAEEPVWALGASPSPLEPGDELDDFMLADLDGTIRSLSGYRGKRVLLVNWSPSCGFCGAIAAELTALHPQLLDRDVELLFMALGDVERNRAVFDPVGLTAPALLREGTDVGPFRGTGTPAAYLIGEDGKLVEAMVVGADQVPALARDLAGVDPEERADGEGRGRYLASPGSVCGPGGGAGAAIGTDWQGTRAYALADHHVGVRYDAHATAEVLDRLFVGARVDDRGVPDNYSVALGGARTTEGTGVARPLKLLVYGGTQLVRSRSGGRVLHALLQYLAADLESADPSLTRVNATAVVRTGEAYLLPPGVVDFLQQLQPRLAKSQMSIVDSPRTLLDLASRELVVPQPSLRYDASVITELDEGTQLGRELPWIPPGRYPLRTWFLARSADHIGALSPAIAVTAALPSLFELDDLVATVERMADLFTDVLPRGIWYESADELVAQVRTALD